MGPATPGSTFYDGIAQTVVKLDSHSSMAQEFLISVATNLYVNSFRRRPSFHSLFNALDKSIKMAVIFLFS